MKPNKLISSMAISLTTVFILLGWTAMMTYYAILAISGGIGGFSFELVLYVIVPVIFAISTILIIILGLVGAHKAKNNPTGKGVFVTIAIFQMLSLLSLLTFGGYWTYFIIQAGAYDALLGMEGWLYVYPTICGGIALFIAFIKNCSGMKAPKNQENVAQARPVPPPPPVPPMYNNQ